MKEVVEKELVYYQTEDGGIPYKEWRDELRDVNGQIAVDKRVRQVSLGTFGDYKPVGEGVVELRFKAKGPGYRIYIGQHGEKLVILLCGGNKSTQKKDVKLAHEYWDDWKRRNR